MEMQWRRWYLEVHCEDLGIVFIEEGGADVDMEF